MSPWDTCTVPQRVHGLNHVRYSGSIERLSIAEEKQKKGVVLVDIQDGSLPVHTRFVELPATPFHDVAITNPQQQLPQLRQRYPIAESALVRCHIRYQPGKDDLYEILSEISRIFPRCYERTWSVSACGQLSRDSAAGTHGRSETNSDAWGNARAEAAAHEPEFGWPSGDNTQQMILDYLASRLVDDLDRDAILALARQLLEEVE